MREKERGREARGRENGEAERAERGGVGERVRQREPWWGRRRGRCN